MPLIESFIRNPVKVAVGVILVVLFGSIAAFQMPMQLTPDVETPTVTVETRWPGASPQEVEREIVQEQEEQLKSVEGVTKMSSESQDSTGRITIEFAVGTDIEQARTKVSTKLEQVREYPADADEPVISTSNLGDRPIAWFVMMPRPPEPEVLDAFIRRHPRLADELRPVREAHKVGLALYRLEQVARAHPGDADLQKILPADIDIPKLKNFAEDFLEARFERVEGISQANVIGGEEQEMQVVVDPERLAARRLTISDVRWALRTQNMDTSAGDFPEGKRRWVVRTLGQLRSPEQVAAVILSRHGGAPVYIRDVAEVRMGYKKPDGLTRRFGRSSLALNCQRKTGSNVLDVMDGLRGANAELNAGLLKQKGLYLEQVYDETEYIYSAIDLVWENILVGAVLTFGTLLLFLRSGRSTLIIAAHIVISTIGAFLVMYLCGRSLNVPALGGLAFAVGMLVDNAIVMLENIYRRHQSGETPMVASVRGAKEVWGALLNASVVNLAVFLPVLWVEEEAGQLFRDIALAISASVGLSLIVAVTVVPTTATRLLRRHKHPPQPLHGELVNGDPALGNGLPFERRRTTPEVDHRGVGGVWRQMVNFLHAAAGVVLRPLDALGAGFVRYVVGINDWLQRSLGLRLAAVAIFVFVSAFLSWWLMPKVEYLPTGNRNLVIGTLLPPAGYNIEQLTEMGKEIEADLKPYWTARPGTPEAARLKYPPIGDFFFVARGRSLFIGLRSAEPLRAAELIPLVQQVAAKHPGTIVVAKQASLFEQGLTAGRTVDIEITGPEIERLVELGGTVLGQVGEVLPNSQAIPRPSLDLNSPEIHVIPKWEQAADMTLTTEELGYTVDALVDGAYASDYFIGGDRIDLTIIGQSQFARRTQQVENLPVATPTGELVMLAAVADVRLSSGPEQINHRERQRAITIQVTPPAEMPLEEAMQRIQQRIVQPLLADPELVGVYQINLAGTANKLTATWNSLKYNMLLAVLLTYLLMAALFESWLYPLVVITSVPLGAVGGIAGLWVLNQFVLQPLDMLTMLGFVILVGTVVNNPILIVEQAILHMDEGMPEREAILQSVRNRIRPIFMTTIAGLMGLLPLVVSPGAGSELYRGMGSVLLGGMVVSTLFTLFLVPSLFSLTMEAKQGLKRRLSTRPPAELDEIPVEVKRGSGPVAQPPSAVHG